MLTRHQLLWAARRSIMHRRLGKPDPKRMDVSQKPTYLMMPECLRHLDYMVDHMHGTRPAVRDFDRSSISPIPVKDVMSDEKINRWLGFIQGALWAHGLASIDDLRDINLTAKHRPDATQATEGCQFDGGDE